MASMVEKLIAILSEELDIYKQFIPICREKTTAIIKNEVDKLQTITVQEQGFLDRIGILEKDREENMENMAVVMGKKKDDLKLPDLIKILEKQPNEQKKLSELHDNLKTTTRKLVEINNHNTSLIKQSLEMIEFNMNFIQSTWMSPGNNNYDKGAKQEMGYISNQAGRFDAKQ